MTIKIIKDNLGLVLCGLAISAMFALFYLVDPALNILGLSRAMLPEYFTPYSAILILAIAFIFYLFGYKKITGNSDSLKIIVIFFVIFNLIFIFGAPITSADLDCYISQGRIWSVHGGNPFIETYDNYQQDKFYSAISNNNSSLPTPYAPLFIFFAGLLTFIGASNLFLAYALFKLAFLIINFLILYLLYRSFPDNKTIYLYAWNPFLLFEFIYNAHNDILTLVLLMLSFFFFFRNKSNLDLFFAWIFLALSVFIKFIPIIFLPLFIIYLYKTLGRLKHRFLAWAAVILVATTALFYLPFGLKAETFSYFTGLAAGMIAQSNALISVIISGLIIQFTNVDQSLPIQISKVAFILIYIYLLISMARRTQAKRIDFIKYSIFALLAFLLGYVTIVFPWYYANLLFLLIIYYALANESRAAYYVFFLTLFAMIQYFYIY